MFLAENFSSSKDDNFKINNVWKIYTDKINGRIQNKSQFLCEQMNFDAHYLTDVGAKNVTRGNSQNLKARTGKLVMMNWHPIFYNGVRIGIVNVVYEFIKAL